MKIAMCWSGGKDNCMALHEIRSSSEYEVTTLLTTVTRDHDGISMHGVPRPLKELLLSRDKQGAAAAFRKALLMGPGRRQAVTGLKGAAD